MQKQVGLSTILSNHTQTYYAQNIKVCHVNEKNSTSSVKLLNKSKAHKAFIHHRIN